MTDPTNAAPQVLSAEIISIGTELTTGKNLDTNAQWLSVELSRIGIPVRFHSTVGDDIADNITVLRHAVERCGLVIVTGGLGPTQDDLTREAMANLAGVPLEFHQPSFDAIHAMFSRRNRAMPERNRVQAMFPAGSESIPNPHGTAPGIWMWLAQQGHARNSASAGGGASSQASGAGHSLMIAMPGVPSEMYLMFHEQVRPRLIRELNLRRVIGFRKINAFGAGESDVESKLLDLTQRGRQPEVGITVHDATISLRIAAAAESDEAAQLAIEPTARLIYERLGSLVFGEGDDELQHIVSEMIKARGLTLAVAEGCTGGMIARRLVAIPGASGWFRGGVVAYATAAKQQLLRIGTDLVQQHGVVSGEVAQAMALACQQQFSSDLAVATVGIAGPAGGTTDKPVGTLWVAVCGPFPMRCNRFTLWGDRAAVQSRAAKQALNQLRLALTAHEPATHHSTS